ncbi:hypothetical protein JRO89_XS04G0202700 [Xanthoceras sorbifolium]|uniref:H15 domain-containing protein n=1 Tax=Xanthoceras sorbifolium TaxID=99658 RepID=A0ABQ8I6H5_9ROSI|nr:hypothetical protein JRO89_XS04G0202700 [Xanthoceras sorbifolium]
MSVSATGQGPRDKSRTPKIKASSDAPAAQLSTPQTSAPPAPVALDVSTDPIVDDSARSCAPKYNALIFEALSALNEPNGSDITAILRYIELAISHLSCFICSKEIMGKKSQSKMTDALVHLQFMQQRNEVPQNFRRLLGSRLRRLVAQEKLEKVQNCFRIKEDNSFVTKTPTPKQKDVRPRLLQSADYITSVDTVEAAAAAAASQIAEAENKSYVAAEAIKEAERISSMAEDTDSQLQLLKEIFERCSGGEIVIMA